MGNELKIIEVAKTDPGITPEEARKICLQKRIRPLSLLEADKIMMDDELREKYRDYLWIWTSDHLSYKAGSTDAILTQWGKKPKPLYLQLKDGYYKPDEHGIPNGAPSNSDDQDARYLVRWQDKDWSGLLARYGCDYGGRRDVYAYRYPDLRLGVLAVKDETKPHKHEWETKCKICDETKKR